jgi:hypothetical protein
MTGTYNTFDALAKFPYQIINFLMDHNEDVFRALKYDDADCWRVDIAHPNLTKSQKGALVWNGITPQDESRIFMTTGISSAFTVQSTQLRISVLEAMPINTVIGQVLIGIEVYPHDLCSQLTNYQPRADFITQSIIETLNGKDIGAVGLGPLWFDNSKNRACRMSVCGSSPYLGKGIVMCTWSGG